MHDTKFMILYFFLCKKNFTVENTIRFFETLLVHHVALDLDEQKKRSSHIIKFLNRHKT